MENSEGHAAKMRDENLPSPRDHADVGVLRPKQHLATKEKASSGKDQNTVVRTSNEKSTKQGSSDEQTSKDSKTDEQKQKANDVYSETENNTKDSEHLSNTNHSVGLESDGLRHRTTASSNSDQQNNSQVCVLMLDLRT